jgi:hypothetical protein
MTRIATDRPICAAFAAAAAVGLALVGLAGCNTTTYAGGSSDVTATGSGPTAATPRQDPMLENIPLPVGFRMVPERSVVRNDGQLRVAMCEYEGQTHPERVVSFYKNYMPSAKFVLRQSRLENGMYSLRFASDVEECNIRVTRARDRTHLVLDLGPLPKGSAEREPQPAAPRQ